MSPALRFLSLVVLGWGGVRAATLGVLPGAQFFAIEPSYARTGKAAPGFASTMFPDLEPPQAWDSGDGAAAYPAEPQYLAAAAPRSQPAAGPVSWRPMSGAAQSVPTNGPIFMGSIPSIDQFAQAGAAVRALPPLPSAAAAIPPRWSDAMGGMAMAPTLDRLQLTVWALLRGRQGLVSAPTSIASGGQLGASQTGARLTYNLDRRLALTARMSNEVGRRGGEVAAGVRVQPVAAIPIWANAERRLAVGKGGGGRNAFALFLEGGVYHRPMPLGLKLDAYAQGGVVGFRRRDAFFDGAMTLTRPIAGRVSGGIGLWGGAQPGVHRLDAGPRLTYRLRPNMAVHLDYRQRLAGNAEPGSGPAVTLAADF